MSLWAGLAALRSTANLAVAVRARVEMAKCGVGVKWYVPKDLARRFGYCVVRDDLGLLISSCIGSPS